jgi:tetratricopeptide (TPR) repeat protein
MTPNQDPTPNHPSETWNQLDRAVMAFEEAWRAGPRPAIEDFLPPPGPHRKAAVQELVQVDLERRWRLGEPAGAEGYLQRFPELRDDPAAAAEVIAAEARLRRECQPGLDPAECFHRFPEYESALRPHLQNLAERSPAAVESILPSAGTGAPTPTGAALAGRPSSPGLSGGSQVAGYEVLGELGRGGMGVVYRARQAALGRVVALKMILAGDHAGPAQRQRFRAEAETVARLRHPHIVQVYEAGEHDGRAYVSMEYAEGGSLAAKLDGTPWDPAAAAGLVATLAGAVDAAHRAGVVHRDLKPGNVLMTGDGTLKVTDFGLARRLEGAGVPTESGVPLGTPSYMAPEQAAGRGKEAGPAADVYALGAILYELLTGRPPFKGPSSLETIRQVLDDEPLPPRRLQPKLPRDLETICLKCLEKEPARRYATAHELAEDLRRFLAGEPIRARPAAWWERGVKWAVRRPAAATALALGVVLLLGFGAATLLLTSAFRSERAAKVEALEARSQAEASEEEVRQNAEEARQKARTVTEVVDFLTGLFYTSDPFGFEGLGYQPGRPGGGQLTALELLDLGREHLEKRLGEQPVVRAAMLDTVGSLYRSIGSYDRAEPLLEEGLKLRRQHLPWPHEDIAVSLFHVAWLRHDQGKFAQAEALYREALKTRRAVSGGDDLQTAVILLNLAWVISHQFDTATEARLAQAEALFRDVVRIRRKHLGDRSRDVGLAMTGLAACLFGQAGRSAEAFLVLGEASRILERPGSQDAVSGALLAYVQSVVARRAHRFAEAKKLHSQVLEKCRLVLGDRHPLTILVLGDYAGLLRQMGELSEAEATLRKAVELGRNSPLYWHPVAVDAILELGDHVLRQKGDAEEAEALYREAVHIADSIGKRDYRERARKKLTDLLTSQDKKRKADAFKARSN